MVEKKPAGVSHQLPAPAGVILCQLRSTEQFVFGGSDDSGHRVTWKTTIFIFLSWGTCQGALPTSHSWHQLFSHQPIYPTLLPVQTSLNHYPSKKTACVNEKYFTRHKGAQLGHLGPGIPLQQPREAKDGCPGEEPCRQLQDPSSSLSFAKPALHELIVLLSLVSLKN